MRWTGGAGRDRRWLTARASALLAALAVAVALGMTAAGATGPAPGRAPIPPPPHRAAARGGGHRAGQWILDDKGGWEYVRYGR